MAIDNPRRNRQTQAGPSLLGAEKRIKQPALNFRANAGSVVFDFDDGDVGLGSFESGTPVSSAQRDEAVAANALRRILNQVDQHLLELLRVAVEPRLPLRLACQPDRLPLQLGRHQFADLVEQQLGSHEDKIRRSGPRQLDKILEDLIDPANLIPDDSRVFMFGASFRERSLYRVQTRVDCGQRVANFVRESGRQLLEVGELLLMGDDRVALDQLDSKRHHHRAPVQVNNQKNA